MSCFKDNDDLAKTNIPNSPDVPQQLWSHAFGSSTATSQTGDDSATGVTIDSRGDVYVVGHVQTALAGQTSQGDFHAFIRKYSADGVLQWTNQFGTDHTDDALDVANDGTTVYVTRTIPANGQIVGYLSDFFPNLPQPFKGILRVSVSSGAVSVVALRQRYNERGDYLITTTPPSIENRSPVAAARSFPHIVDGGGYTTQFVLFSGTAGQSTAGTMKFYKQNGTSMPVGLR